MIKVPMNIITRFSKSKNGWTILGAGLAELVFAPCGICPVCGQERSVRQGLGHNCLARLLLVVPPVCSRCGRPLRLNSQKQSICKQCAATEYYFRQARAVALYEGALREYLTDLKYRFRPELGVALGELLVEWSKLNRRWRQNDLIIPVPLHQQKMVARGYNQAELIARPLGAYWGKKILTEAVVREKPTQKQNDLSKQERFLNIANAFRVLKPQLVAGKRILVIDDILTTGATVSEVARMLLKAGALRVDVLTVATGVVESDWISK
jgi:competence protein ComFC